MTKVKQATSFTFKHIEKNYGKGKQRKRILCDASVSLIGGECTLLTGQNGSGKSTLLRILGGLLKPDSCTVYANGTQQSWQQYRKAMTKNIMYLYQEPYMFDGSVQRNLRYALGSNQTHEAIEKALNWAELSHRQDTQAKYLSGGERQRVALAQAWLKQPSVLLLDEPTANMDNNSRQRTEALLASFKQAGTALVIASHDPKHFASISDTCLVLSEGQITATSQQHPDKATITSHQPHTPSYEVSSTA